MITQARLKELLDYDPSTGIFRRKVSNNNRVKVGDTAGSATYDGYLRIGVLGYSYLAHRLAWLYEFGYFPEHQIDHLNGVRHDNRIENLRHVAQVCNLQNRKVNSNNTSGFPGVCWAKQSGAWKAQIKINNKRIHIGFFDTAIEAALARFNFEVVDPRWTCNHRSNLAKEIKSAWPEFKGCHV